ncbi:MAG: tetratricopeptide repeat protein [Candidatus Omnitrophota bacterium]|jgi:tetratricopeptide (TPR) repeat protein
MKLLFRITAAAGMCFLVLSSVSAQDRPVLDTLMDKTMEFYQAGKYAEAEVEAKKAVELAEKTFTQPMELDPYLDVLSAIYVAQSKFSEAEPLYKKQYEILKNTLGPNDQETVTTMNNLSLVYKDLGRYSESETLLKEQLNIIEKEAGSSSVEAIATLHNLSDIYIAQKEFAKAEPVLKRVLTAYEEKFGKENPSLADLLGEMDDLYQKLGQQNEAAIFKARREKLSLTQPQSGKNKE